MKIFLNVYRDTTPINMQLQQSNQQTRNYNKPTINYQATFKAVISSNVRSESNYQESPIPKQAIHHSLSFFGTDY